MDTMACAAGYYIRASTVPVRPASEGPTHGRRPSLGAQACSMQGDETDGTMMEASIKYQVDGREVSRDQFLRAMQNNFHKMVAENLVGLVTSRLADVRCEIHGVSPTVVLMEQSGTNASFALRDLCCENLKAKAEEAFKPTRGPSAE
jgi:hypothetical protein